MITANPYGRNVVYYYRYHSHIGAVRRNIVNGGHSYLGTVKTMYDNA